MKKIFINFTNHPSDSWGAKQRAAAEKYGAIVDIPFPAVDAKGDEEYIIRMSDDYVKKIEMLKPKAVLCQGEFSLAYQIISKLKARNILTLAACSERCVTIDGKDKKVTFVFERFRKY